MQTRQGDVCDNRVLPFAATAGARTDPFIALFPREHPHQGEADMFVQMIEWSTDQPGEFDALLDRWIDATGGKRSATRSVLGRDRSAPSTYVQFVEFPSQEEAARNSDLPETQEMAAKAATLCTSGPSFRDLDVVRIEEL